MKINTIQNYTAVLLAIFTQVKVTVETGKTTKVGKLPVVFSSREKLVSTESFDLEDLKASKVNQLPRGSLSLESLSFDETRLKNQKFVVQKKDNKSTKDVQYAPVPYNLNYRLSVMARGESSMFSIVEQICSRFSPFLHNEVEVQEGLSKQPLSLKLTDVSIEYPDISDETSNNILTAEFSFTLYGNLYREVQNQPIVTDYKITVGVNGGRDE